jgi:hypothetical protein
MSYDESKVEEAVLAVLYLGAFTEHGVTRAWKGIDWEVLGRLFERGLINDPRNKNKSVAFTPDGLAHAKAAAQKLFDVNADERRTGLPSNKSLERTRER